MRKVLFGAMALTVGLALAVPSSAQAQEAEVKTVLDKAIKAIGGADKAKQLDQGAYTAKAKGNIEAMGMKIDFTLEAFSQPPNKSKAIINISVNGMQIEIVQAFDGNKGWASVLGMVKDTEEEEIEEHNAMVHVESVTNLFALTQDKAFKLSPLGESKVGDTPVVGVQVAKKDKREVNLYFDKKTHLLLKTEYRAVEPISKMEVAQEKIFSDYKEMLPGLKMASKQIVNNDGKRYLEIEMTEVTAVERHDDSIFRKPE
jgi:negative regulator of sigma E activity